MGRRQASQRVRLGLDPPPDNTVWYRGQNQGKKALFPGARIFVSWYDGYFYPAILQKDVSWYVRWTQGGKFTRELAGFQVLAVEQAVAKRAQVLALSGTPGGKECYGKACGVAMAGDKVFLQAAQDDGRRHNIEVDLARLAIGDPDGTRISLLRTGKDRLSSEERTALGMAPSPGGRTGFRSQDGRDHLFSGATVFISCRDGFWYPAVLRNQSDAWRAWWRPGGEGVANLDQCAILSLAGAIARKSEVYASANGASLGKLVDWYPTRDAENRPVIGLLTSKKTCYLLEVKIKTD